MPIKLFQIYLAEQIALVKMLVRWGLIGILVGVISGVTSAIFLHTLEWATFTRENNNSLLFFLPIAGLVIGFIYDRFGKSVTAGNNLLLESIHSEEDTAKAVPLRMAPLVLLGTVVTHLFGGSAGREGTAVQMAGSLSAQLSQIFKLSVRDYKLTIICGVSGGFGAVFGTPLAGTIFGLEVLTIGAISYQALIPCFVASYIGDLTCRALGIAHHQYNSDFSPVVLTPSLWVGVCVLGVCSAFSAWIFTELTEIISHTAKQIIKCSVLLPFVGGVLVIGLTLLAGTSDYLGLSLPLIEKSFTPGGVIVGAFALKILFTAITLGTGFKGGEVTPLFCIGATLGAAVGHYYGDHIPFFAALGFVAVFAGAANTPLTCAVMGMELFGAQLGIPLFAVCIISYVLSGHRGIYISQKITVPKGHGIDVQIGSTVSEVRDDINNHARSLIKNEEKNDE